MTCPSLSSRKRLFRHRQFDYPNAHAHMNMINMRVCMSRHGLMTTSGLLTHPSLPTNSTPRYVPDIRDHTNSPPGTYLTSEILSTRANSRITTTVMRMMTTTVRTRMRNNASNGKSTTPIPVSSTSFRCPQHDRKRGYAGSDRAGRGRDVMGRGVGGVRVEMCGRAAPVVKGLRWDALARSLTTACVGLESAVCVWLHMLCWRLGRMALRL